MRYVDVCFPEVTIVKDIHFTEALNVEGEREQLKLDVYLPKEDSDTKRCTILWIHGGGFLPGNYKDQGYIVEFATRFARKGYVCVSPDYRLRANPNENFAATMSDCLSDVFDALEWIRKNGNSYGMDIHRIFIAGGSAGGMIAVNLCYGDGSYGPSRDLKGVLAMMNLWGSPHTLKVDIRPDSLPALIVHGTADQAVSIENSYHLVKQLEKADVPHVFIPLEGAPHTPMMHLEQMDREFARFLHEFI